MTNDLNDSADIKRQLLNLESRIDRLVTSPSLDLDAFSSPRYDEINFWDIWGILWRRKWWIVGITTFFVVGSVFFAMTLPNQYKAEMVLAPAQKEGGMGSMAAQYSGLAAIAGLNLGGAQSSDVDQALALVTSQPFLEAFIEKYKIKPQLMAVKSWDRSKDKVIYNEELFDSVNQEWMLDQKTNKSLEPSNFRAYRALNDRLTISRDSKSALIRLSVEHYVPQLAYEWTRLLVQELNRYFQLRDMQEASRNIEYLQEKVGNTSISEMQSVFYRMIESQMKILMLAEVSSDYLLKPAVPPSLPEDKSRPKRALMCVIGLLLGGVLSVMLVIVHHFIP